MEQPQEPHARSSSSAPLQNEPGFRDCLRRPSSATESASPSLNSMNPQQRDRTLERNESLEHLHPPQVQQLPRRRADLRRLPPDRRRVVWPAPSVDLREMPPEQREQVIDSPRFGAQFYARRATLNNLIAHPAHRLPPRSRPPRYFPVATRNPHYIFAAINRA